MDTQSYRKENKGALYEHPCLLYEAKKRKGENEDGNEPLLSTLSPCGYSPCLRERVGWRGETLNINHNHTHMQEPPPKHRASQTVPLKQG